MWPRFGPVLLYFYLFFFNADMRPSYGLLVAQIRQTGVDYPNAIILHSMNGPEQGVRSGLDLGQN